MAVAVHTAEAVHAVGSLLFQKINSRAYILESVMLGTLTMECVDPTADPMERLTWHPLSCSERQESRERSEGTELHGCYVGRKTRLFQEVKKETSVEGK